MDNPGHYDEYPELTRAEENRPKRATKMTLTTPSPISPVKEFEALCDLFSFDSDRVDISPA